MKGSKVEEKVCAYARKRDMLALKFTSTSTVGVPDRIFIGNNIVFFIEFKTEGERLSEMQQRVIGRFLHRNANVFVCDNVPYGKTIVDRMFAWGGGGIEADGDEIE